MKIFLTIFDINLFNRIASKVNSNEHWKADHTMEKVT